MKLKWIKADGRFYDVHRAKSGLAVDVNKTRHLKYICRDLNKAINWKSSSPSHRIKLSTASDLIYGATQLLNQLATNFYNDIYGTEKYPEIDTEENIILEQFQDESLTSFTADKTPILDKIREGCLNTESDYQRSSDKLTTTSTVPKKTLQPLAIPDLFVTDENAEDCIQTYKEYQSIDTPATSTIAVQTSHLQLNVPDLVLIDTMGCHSKLSISRSLLPFNQSIFETFENFTKSEYMDLPSVSQMENTKRKKKRILIDEGSKSIIIRRPPKISREILDKKRESQRVNMKSKIHPKRLLKHSNFASRVLSELIGRNMIMSRDDKTELENLDKLLFLESNDTAKMQRNTAEHIHCTRAEMIEGDNSNTGICSVELTHTQTAENVNNNSSPKRQSSLIDKSYFAKPPLGSETEIWKNYSTPLIKPSEGLDKVKVNLFPPRVVVRDSLSPILSLSSDEDKCDVDSDGQDGAISNLREDDTIPATKEQGKENVLEEVIHSFSPVMTENNSFLHKEDGEQSTSRSEDATSPKHHSTEHHSPQGSKNKRRKFSTSNNERYEDYTTGLSNQMNKNDLKEEKRSTSPVLEARDGELSTSESEDATSPKQYPTEHRSSSNRKKKRRKFSKSNRENREDSAAGGSDKQSKARQFSVGPTGTEKVLSFILTERDDDLSGTKVVIADLHNHKSLYKHLRHIKHDDSSSEE